MRCIDASTYNPQRPGRRSTSPNRATNTSPTLHTPTREKRRRWPVSSHLRSSRCTARVTGNRGTSRQGPCWLSVGATPVSRSRRSSPAHTRSISRSAHGKRRCPRRFGSATCSGGSPRHGLLNMTVDSRLGRRLSERETLIGSSPKQLRRLGVDLHPRAVSASHNTVSFADGTQLRVDAVVWATGYQPDYSWIEAPVLDAGGRVRHHRGVTNLPGLYFLGLYWQHTRGSALLGWVKDDAEYIATQIQILADSRKGGQRRTNRAHPEQEKARRSPIMPNHSDHTQTENRGNFPTDIRDLPDSQPSEVVVSRRRGGVRPGYRSDGQTAGRCDCAHACLQRVGARAHHAGPAGF